ncbi:MAG: hypothetical protein MJ152_00470 [Clostridia bacterium]|nr:hypothetical protein [Clostridia bacterium]
MTINNKKLLTTIVYYTLVVLALVSVGFFFYALTVNAVAMWAKVVYFIWAGLVVGEIVFDVICTNSRQDKTMSGFVVYILSVLSVAMACILYVINTWDIGLATDFLPLFTSVSMLALMASGYLIATWCVGKHMVGHETSIKENNRE